MTVMGPTVVNTIERACVATLGTER
jgi:hypothetical protein